MSDEARFLKSDENGKLFFCDEDDKDVEYAMIPIQEYNGYQNAIRIVRDRALQQIDKAQADEHGYTLVELERYDCDRGNKRMCWKITKSTPYSIKIALDDAFSMIRQDMYDFYGYRPLPYTTDSVFRMQVEFRELVRIAAAYDEWIETDPERWDKYNKTGGWDGTQFVEDNDGWIVSDIQSLKCNRARGVYVVTYLSTRPV